MTILQLALGDKQSVHHSMAAGIADRVLEIRKDSVRESMSDFQNIEHRLEHVATIDGVDFINDSKATNVNSTWYALESMERPVVWIMGGQDKGNDYTDLVDLVKQKVRAIVCLGKDNTKIKAAFAHFVSSFVETVTTTDAVREARAVAEVGDVVLLSPANASFDLFDNYEDRGQKFKSAVRGI